MGTFILSRKGFCIYMKYNFCEIGERIRQMRKKKFSNQEAFIEELREKYKVPIGRNKVSAIENGEQGQFTLPFLLACCNIFNCDMGYLLGEYGDCKTRDSQFIHEQTNLSELSISRISKEFGISENSFLETVLSSDLFWELDYEFSNLESTIKRSNARVHSFEQLEIKLKGMDSSSQDAQEINEQLGKMLMYSARDEERMLAEEYKVSLAFSKLLEQYRKKEVVIYGTH